MCTKKGYWTQETFHLDKSKQEFGIRFTFSFRRWHFQRGSAGELPKKNCLHKNFIDIYVFEPIDILNSLAVCAPLPLDVTEIVKIVNTETNVHNILVCTSSTTQLLSPCEFNKFDKNDKGFCHCNVDNFPVENCTKYTSTKHPDEGIILNENLSSGVVIQ